MIALLDSFLAQPAKTDATSADMTVFAATTVLCAVGALLLPLVG